MAAATLESEIYLFRTGMGRYLTAPESRKAEALAKFAKNCAFALASNVAEESLVKQEFVNKLRGNNYQVGVITA